jgi:hypothetical protein
MPDPTVIAGVVIPSTSPLFLAGVGIHVGAGLVCVVAGALAMLSRKRRGRHSTAGTVYYRSLAVVCGSAAVLAVVRWPQDAVLLALATTAFAAAHLGRAGMRRRHAVRLHVTGMGSSYIILLTAFYVDNGKFLPVWRDLSPVAYWLVPAVVGLPILVWALLRHPLARAAHPPEA